MRHKHNQGAVVPYHRRERTLQHFFFQSLERHQVGLRVRSNSFGFRRRHDRAAPLPVRTRRTTFPLASLLTVGLGLFALAIAVQLLPVDPLIIFTLASVVTLCGLLLVVAQIVTAQTSCRPTETTSYERQSRVNEVERGHEAQRRPAATLDGLVITAHIEPTITNGSEEPPSLTRQSFPQIRTNPGQLNRGDRS